MRIKIPRPLHGWREFAGEVGIIVFGVLIALGAQQLIGRWDDHEKFDRAIAALRVELAYHESNAAEIEMAMPCMFAQLDLITDRIKAGDGAPLPRFTDQLYAAGFVIRMPHRIYSDATWQSVNSSDILRRLDPARSDELSIYYQQLSNHRLNNDTASDGVASLNTLSQMMPRGEEGRLRFLEQAEQLRSKIDKMNLASGQLRNALAHLHMVGPRSALDKDLADSGTLKFCRAHGFPIAGLRPANPTAI